MKRQSGGQAGGSPGAREPWEGPACSAAPHALCPYPSQGPGEQVEPPGSCWVEGSPQSRSGPRSLPGGGQRPLPRRDTEAPGSQGRTPCHVRAQLLWGRWPPSSPGSPSPLEGALQGSGHTPKPPGSAGLQVPPDSHPSLAPSLHCSCLASCLYSAACTTWGRAGRALPSTALQPQPWPGPASAGCMRTAGAGPNALEAPGTMNMSGDSGQGPGPGSAKLKLEAVGVPLGNTGALHARRRHADSPSLVAVGSGADRELRSSSILN